MYFSSKNIRLDSKRGICIRVLELNDLSGAVVGHVLFNFCKLWAKVIHRLHMTRMRVGFTNIPLNHFFIASFICEMCVGRRIYPAAKSVSDGGKNRLGPGLGQEVKGSRLRDYCLRDYSVTVKLLPLHRALLRGVDFSDPGGLAKEVAADVIEQKVLGVRIRKIESVVVNDLALLLQPCTPTRLTDFCSDLLP